MRIQVQSRLSYWFDAPVEVLLLVEAAKCHDQTVHDETLWLSPNVQSTRLDDTADGERRLVLSAQGAVDINYQATVDLPKRPAGLGGLAKAPIRQLPAEALQYLRPSHYCPSDRFQGFALREFGNLEGGDKVEAILSWISHEVDYVFGVSNAETTALDTFIDRAGVCRDFTHLTITLCRAAGIPARAVSAYAWNLYPADMHAIAEVFVGGAWRLVDPTGKAPIEGLVRVATGRDATDIAFMTIFGGGNLVNQSFSAISV